MQKILFLTIILISLSSCTDQVQEATKQASNQQEENIALVSQYFEYFNNHNWEEMASMYIENAEFKDPSLGPGIVKQSHKEIIAKYAELNAIFPDLHDEVIQVYPSGEKCVIVEFVSSGTAPDNSKFELPICTIFTFENGKITKDYTYFDNFDEESEE